MSNLWVTATYYKDDAPHWIDDAGEYPVDTEHHRLQSVPIEDLQTGDLARQEWATHLPFQRVTGPSIHDPSHPSDTSGDPDEEFPTKMYVAQFKRTLSPHQPDGSIWHVYRGHP
jgi:hypothetical protein